ncbi:MAG: hypothetical protein JW940_24320 [Polyangiaceae bacterium]|nr:hypothetical protein [Polyangiaceae bacterium]
MKRLAGLLCMTFGAAPGLLGLLFLVGAAGQMRRLVVGAILLASAAALVLFGSRLAARARLESPEVLVPELLRLAELGSGAITEAQVVAALGDRARLGLKLLQTMVSAGECRRELREGRFAFVFHELLPHLVVRRCRFCGFESPLNRPDADAACPSCGGQLVFVRGPGAGPGAS